MNEQFKTWIIGHFKKYNPRVKNAILATLKFHPDQAEKIISSNLVDWVIQANTELKSDKIEVVNSLETAKELVQILKDSFAEEIKGVLHPEFVVWVISRHESFKGGTRIALLRHLRHKPEIIINTFLEHLIRWAECAESEARMKLGVQGTKVEAEWLLGAFLRHCENELL